MTENEKAIVNSDSSFKEIRLVFPNHEIEDIENDRVYLDNMSIEEFIFDGDAISFGDCNSSVFKIRVADFNEDVKGARMNAYVHYTNEELGEVDVAFGKYIVTDLERTSDRRWRDITAMDYMTLFDVDIADWYNTTLFPSESTKRTVKQIRTMLCTLIGVTQQNVDLANDTLQIGKSVSPQTLSARELLRCCCEVNECFGHFNWSGVLEYIKLESKGLYPSTTLYPSSTLYPRRASSDGKGNETILTYKQDGCQYADYNVAKIDSVGIMKEDGDLSVHADVTPNYTNRYNIIGNILLYGFSTSELQTIANTILTEIGNLTYTPNSTEIYGGIYMSLGQEYSVKATTYVGTDIIDKTFSAYVLKRTISGIQAMSQVLEADGQEYQPETVGYDVESQYKILNGKSASYKRDLEALEVEYQDFEERTNSRFIQTANEIETTVAQATSKYDERNYTIDYYGFGSPLDSSVTSDIVGKLYLDQNNGWLYEAMSRIESDETVYWWSRIAVLSLITTNLSTRITQNTTSIESEVTRATQAENGLEEDYTSKISQTADTITSTVSNTQTKWLEEYPVGTPITIDYRDYGNPKANMTSEELARRYPNIATGKLYLDVNRGIVYQVHDIRTTEGELDKYVEWWTYANLTTVQSHNETVIEQTNSQIVLKADANGNLALVELGADASTGTHFTVQADDISLEGKTFNLTTDEIQIHSNHFNVDKFGNTHIEGGGVTQVIVEDYPGSEDGRHIDVTSQYDNLTYAGTYGADEELPTPSENEYIVVLNVYDRRVGNNYIYNSGNGDPDEILPPSASTFKQRYIDLTSGMWYYCAQGSSGYAWIYMGVCDYFSDRGSVSIANGQAWSKQTNRIGYINTAVFDINGTTGLTLDTPQLKIGDGGAEFSGDIKGSSFTGGSININDNFIVDIDGNTTANSFTSENGTIIGGTIQGSEITGVDMQTKTLQVKDSLEIYYHYTEEDFEEDRIAGTIYGHETAGDAEHSVLDIETEVLLLRSGALRAVFNCPVYADSYQNTSDKRIKENFEDISLDYENAYYELKPLIFNYIGKNEHELGLIAQDLEALLEKYKINKDNCFIKKIPDEKLGMKYTLDYTKFIPWNMHMIQKQHNEINNLKEELATLKEQVAFLMQGGKR